MPVTDYQKYQNRANMAFAILEFFLKARKKASEDEPEILVPEDVLNLELAAAKVLKEYLTIDEK